MVSFESALVLGVIGLYLYDSIMLLKINELIIVNSAGKWSYKFPIFGYQLLRKYPLITNVFTPSYVVFKTFWPGGGDCASPKKIESFIKLLWPVQMLVTVLLCLFFVFLPIVSFVYGSGVILLGVFLLIYVVIVGVLTFVFFLRKKLHLTNYKFISIAFESLVCPPLSMNIVKKITLQHPNIGDPYLFSKNTFDSDTLDHFVVSLASAVDRNLKFLERGSSHYLYLDEYLHQIKKD